MNLPISEAVFNNSIAGMTVGNLKPFHVAQIANMLKGRPNYRQADELAGANEPTLSTIFANANGLDTRPLSEG
jgi:hypothetical protein